VGPLEKSPFGSTWNVIPSTRRARFGTVKLSCCSTSVQEPALATLHSDNLTPFDKLHKGTQSLLMINHLGDEVIRCLGRVKMAFLVEAISVVILIAKLLAAIRPGLGTVQANCAHATLCADCDLVRVRFMTPEDSEQYVQHSRPTALLISKMSDPRHCGC